MYCETFFLYWGVLKEHWILFFLKDKAMPISNCKLSVSQTLKQNLKSSQILTNSNKKVISVEVSRTVWPRQLRLQRWAVSWGCEFTLWHCELCFTLLNKPALTICYVPLLCVCVWTAQGLSPSTRSSFVCNGKVWTWYLHPGQLICSRYRFLLPWLSFDLNVRPAKSWRVINILWLRINQDRFWGLVYSRMFNWSTCYWTQCWRLSPVHICESCWFPSYENT